MFKAHLAPRIEAFALDEVVFKVGSETWIISVQNGLLFHGTFNEFIS